MSCVFHFMLPRVVKNKYSGKKLKYELYATSNHIGSVSFGHYTALAKHYATDQWYHFNDSWYVLPCVYVCIDGICCKDILNFSLIKSPLRICKTVF